MPLSDGYLEVFGFLILDFRGQSAQIGSIVEFREFQIVPVAVGFLAIRELA